MVSVSEVWWQVFLGGHLSEDLQGKMGRVDDGGREGQACPTKVRCWHHTASNVEAQTGV